VLSPEITVVEGVLRFVCPRCHGPAAERLYGPCQSCRQDLCTTLGREPSSESRSQPARFEPKMNVVPNHVATKDDDDIL
jgi:hypothetical protein